MQKNKKKNKKNNRHPSTHLSALPPAPPPPPLKINAGLRSAAFTFLGKCVNRRVARLLGIRAVDINLFLQFS